MACALANVGSVCCCSSSCAILKTSTLQAQGSWKVHTGSVLARPIPCGCRTAASRVLVTSCTSLTCRDHASSASSPLAERSLRLHTLRPCSGSPVPRQGSPHADTRLLSTVTAAAAVGVSLADVSDVGASQDAVYSVIEVDAVAELSASDATAGPSPDFDVFDSAVAEISESKTLCVVDEAEEIDDAFEGDSATDTAPTPPSKAAKLLLCKTEAAASYTFAEPAAEVPGAAAPAAGATMTEAGYADSASATTPHAAAMSILDNERLAGTASLSQALLRRTSSQMSRSATAAMNPLIGRNALSRGSQSESAIAVALLAATATVAGVVTLFRSRRLAASVLPIQIQECEDELCCVCDGDGKCACHFCGGSGKIVWEGKMLRKDPCPACVGEGHERCPSCGHTFKL